MPRNMAFSLTTPQMYAKHKDVTRRLGWWNIKSGEIISAVEKGMGLKKGEKVRRIRLIEIISTRPERLLVITQEDVIREGFRNMNPEEFIEMFCRANKCHRARIVNRIEFRHLGKYDI